MAPLPFKAEQAAQVCLHFDLTDEAKPLLVDDQPPESFLEQLIKHGRYIDAIKFMAHGLPKREVVWWVCQCVRGVEAACQAEADQQLVELAEQWVCRASEEHRRAAMEAAEKSGYETPAAWAATSAAWSGGSLAPPDQPVVPPGEHLTAHAASGAISLAAAKAAVKDINQQFKTFVEVGLEVAKGANHWPDRAA